MVREAPMLGAHAPRWAMAGEVTGERRAADDEYPDQHHAGRGVAPRTDVRGLALDNTVTWLSQLATELTAADQSPIEMASDE